MQPLNNTLQQTDFCMKQIRTLSCHRRCSRQDHCHGICAQVHAHLLYLFQDTPGHSLTHQCIKIFNGQLQILLYCDVDKNLSTGCQRSLL